MPAEMDELNRKIMQMEIEETALKKEDDRLSKERLEHLQQELAELRDEFAGKKAQWDNEKVGIERVQKLREAIEQVNKDIEKAKHSYDLEKAAELQYGKLPQLQKQLEDEEAKVKDEDLSLVHESVNDEEIGRIVSRWTGIPVAKLNESFNSESAKGFSKFDLKNTFESGYFSKVSLRKKEPSNLELEAVEIANEIKGYARIFKENVFDAFVSKYESISYNDFEILKKQAPLIETLIDCVREYSKILTRKKFEQQKYTFNDIARFCHDILVDENGNRTAVAERYSEEFAEIIC